jgi:hypothetical protein
MRKSRESSPATKTAITAPAADETGWNPSELKSHYDRFSPMALAMDGEPVDYLRADPLLVLRNVRIGVDSLHSVLQRVKRELPLVDTRVLLELPEMAGAAVYANRQIIDPVSSKEIAERLSRVKPLRRELIAVADLFVRRGMMPADRVMAIKAGFGPIDTALDAVDLANLYIEYWDRIASKHAFTREEITELAKDGEWLVKTLNPKGARKEAPVQTDVARLVRDRLYALIAERHQELRRVGNFVWGAEVDSYVPKLTSRLGTTRTTAAPAAPSAPAVPADHASDSPPITTSMA